MGAGTAGNRDALILKLGTQDGFEVAFALDEDHAGSLGAALLSAPREIPGQIPGEIPREVTPAPAKRPN